jgi:ABC-type phosphate/phosphonate transport system substrate-binding protein
MLIKNKFLIVFLGVCLLSVPSLSYADVNLGVLAPRGKLNALKQWKEFGQYLQQQLQQPVNIVPLPPPDVLAAVRAREIDFLLTNPVHTVNAVESYGATLLATLSKASGTEFAGVIVSRKGSGIKTAKDLRNKHVMSLKFKDAAGAYTFQTYHLHQRGIDPHKDFASMREGKKQDDLILAVKAGVIDAAFVRTGILESMEKEGKIKIDEFEIVDQHGPDDIKLLHSTEHYPEWYLSALKGTDAKLAQRLAKAALTLSPDEAAAKSAKIKGFIKPIKVDGMVAALKTLKIAPFNTAGGEACR